jgi:hypothetical protein
MCQELHRCREHCVAIRWQSVLRWLRLAYVLAVDGEPGTAATAVDVALDYGIRVAKLPVLFGRGTA